MSEITSIRQYQSRYDQFWKSINWSLPDSVLAQVWQVDRANLHARRVRHGRGSPRWTILRNRDHPVFQAAVQLESLKARKFAGAKPSNTSAPILKVSKMRIATEISLEIVKRRDDNGLLLDLHVRLLDARGKQLSADIDAEENMAHPKIISSTDTLNMEPGDREAFAMAAYFRMIRYFGDGPTGGMIKWASWIEADLIEWVRESFYEPMTSRIIRTFSYPAMSGSSVRSFTQSLED